MFGRRPIDTRTTSASIVEASPPAAGSTVRTTLPPFFFSALVTLVEVPDVEALLLEDLRAFLADLAVHAGQDLVEKLDDDDLGAEPPPDRAELQPDHAAADHHHRLGHLVELERGGGIEDDLMIDLDAGQRRDAGAGGDDEILRLVALAADVDRILGGEFGMALQPFDLVLPEQEFDAAGEALDRLQPRLPCIAPRSSSSPEVFTPHLASAPECASS